MSDLISQIFTNKKNKKLVTFVTGGDPDFATSNLIIEIIVKNNIDILIHGHTHRPFIHHIDSNSIRAVLAVGRIKVG